MFCLLRKIIIYLILFFFVEDFDKKGRLCKIYLIIILNKFYFKREIMLNLKEIF